VAANGRHRLAAVLFAGLVASATVAGCAGSPSVGGQATVTSSSGESPVVAVTPGVATGIDGRRYEVTTSTTSIPSVRPDVPADPADVYLPTQPRSGGTGYPVALFLQGGLTDKGDYTDYASAIASYGFVVLVPNHERLLFGRDGLYAESAQVIDVAAWAKAEATRADSALAGLLDPSTLVLMGHSFGGASALSAVDGECRVPFCIVADRDYPARPPEVKAASLFGTNLSSPTGDAVPAVDTAGVPVTFIQGSSDVATTPAETDELFGRMTGARHTIVTVDGIGHFGLVDADAANAPAPGEAALDQAASIEVAARWTAQTLLAALGDAAATQYVTTNGDPADPQVTVKSQP
jgi:predicted dienelactone hydrolase